MNYLKDIESLRIAFFRLNRPYWKIYHDRAFKVKVDDQLQCEDMEESWQHLEETLSLFGSGTLTICLLTDPKVRKEHYRVIYYRIQSGSRSSGISSTGGTVASGASPAGFHQILQMFQVFQRMTSQGSEGSYDAGYSQAKQELELERAKEEIRRIKREKEKTPVNAFVEGIGSALAQKFMGNQVGLMGTVDLDEKPNQQSGKEDNAEEGPSAQSLDMNLPIRFASAVNQLLPDRDINDVFARLIQFVETQPDTARTVFKSLES